MIVAMYLTKDLMIDWRLGERVRMRDSYYFFALYSRFAVSTFHNNSWTAISLRIMADGNGLRALERTHSRTSAYSTLSLSPSRAIRRVHI